METEFYADETHPWANTYRVPVVYNSAYLIPTYALVLVLSDEWNAWNSGCLVTEQEAQLLGCYVDYLVCDGIDASLVMERSLSPLDTKDNFNTLFVSKSSLGRWSYYRKHPQAEDYSGEYTSLVGMLNFIEADLMSDDIKSAWRSWKSAWNIV